MSVFDIDGRIDEARLETLASAGELVQLLEVKALLGQKKRIVESKITDPDVDEDWKRRALNFIRFCDSWLARLKPRIHVLSQAKPADLNIGAVVIQGAGHDAESAAQAINAFLQAGSYVMHAFVVGRDLVVLAKEPKQ